MPDHPISANFEIILVTARALSKHPLLTQLERVLHRQSLSDKHLPRPHRIILREKDLSDTDYTQLAASVAALCTEEEIHFMWQSHVSAARSEVAHIQMGMGDFCQLTQGGGQPPFESCWVSVHSPAEAHLAEQRGASALIYGHVYETACKSGLPPRGLNALREIIELSSLPVYAIGGIASMSQIAELEKLGCAGACIMSSYMTM